MNSLQSVDDFGATGDGETLDTEALQTGMDAVERAGGGILYVPPGDYLIGTLRLRDRVTLYLEAGATLWGSERREEYEEGCLIYAEDVSDAAIRGRGTIDGQGESFWVRGYYDSDPETERWLTGEWRPSRMIRLVRCTDLLLEDVTLRNSPAWTVHLVACDRVTARGLAILNGVYEDDGPNTDGIVPDGCSNVRISDCYLQTGDDSIVLKNKDDYPDPTGVCRDITVTNCVLLSSETALKIGSETHGTFRNVTFANCAVRDAGCGIGLWMRDGGLIDGWRVQNVTMTLTEGGTPIYFWSHRRTDDTPWGTVRNVSISGVTAEADGAIFISGTPEAPLEQITIDDVEIFMRGATEKEHHDDPPHPITVWGHRKCTSDIFCRYVEGLRLRDVRLVWNEPEQSQWGSAVRCRHVTNLELAGFQGRQALRSGAPAIELKDVDGAWIHDCWPPEETGTFLECDEDTRRITVSGNNFARADEILADEGDESAAIHLSGNRPPAGDRP